MTQRLAIVLSRLSAVVRVEPRGPESMRGAARQYDRRVAWGDRG